MAGNPSTAGKVALEASSLEALDGGYLLRRAPASRR